MRYLLFLTLCFLFSGNAYCQTVIIDGIPRDTSFTVYSTYIKESKKRPHIQIVTPQKNKDIIAKEKVIYSQPNRNRNLHLNIYRPDDNKKYPALLLVHGGGWNSGDLTLQIPLAQAVAAKGYVAMPVEYRLSPEAIYPAAVHDLKNAIRWIRANADKYNIDTTKIAISGCSAGGQLAALIGTTNGQKNYENQSEYSEYSTTVHAVINIDGISDFTVPEALENVNASLAKNKIPASVKWLGGSFDDNKETWIEASSVYHVTESSAPICFINSSIPRFHDGRDEIIEKLNKYNIYTEVHTIEDTPHPFWLLHPWFDTTVKYMVDYLEKIF